MKPFDDYPGGGYTILQTLTGGNARRGYGYWLVKRGQTGCAYCGASLVEDYYRWLLLSVDHVIPEGEYGRLGIPRKWGESYSNIVLACLGCNVFDNKYEITWQEPMSEWSEAEFFELRDRVFAERALRIKNVRDEDVGFFEQKVKVTP